MMMKPGVRMAGIRPEMAIACQIAESVYRMHNEDLIITSFSDGKHKPDSLHYKGAAMDIRTWNLKQFTPNRMAEALAAALGEEFDIIVEADHIHVEFDPK